MASLCNPHVWDYQNWLPLIVDTAPADYPAMTCQNCGRVLAGNQGYLTEPTGQYRLFHRVKAL